MLNTTGSASGIITATAVRRLQQAVAVSRSRGSHLLGIEAWQPKETKVRPMGVEPMTPRFPSSNLFRLGVMTSTVACSTN